MDCIEDQPPNFKHYCRVCKKGFMCGRALGGHMRAHGIGDENGNLDEEDPTSDWEDKSDRTSNKRMYQLRTNPNRLKSCRICENCGKEFFSWKAFLEHGKCSSDAESLLSSPESEAEEDEGGGRRGGGGWTKRKRSLRAKVGNTIISSAYPSSEDEDLLLAKCLVQLANTRVELPTMVAEMESSSTSASREEERRNAMANFFSPRTSTPLEKGKGVSSNNSKGIFECKACKKVFNSHQALGGHRASHKKVKGCYAAKQDQDHQLDDHSLADDNVITREEFFPASKSPYNSPTMQFEQGPTELVGAARRKSKVHECTICHRVFSSGQALGGHKRCHWITSNSPADTTKLQFHHHVEPINHYKPKINNFDQALDLNLPAWADDISGLRRDPHNPLSFDVSTDIHLHPWINTGGEETDTKNIYNHPHQYYQKNEDDNNKNNGPRADGNNNNSNSVSHSVDDEADSSLRLAKLSDLKDMNPSGSSSQWLQVGIGSTTACEQLSLSSGNKDIYLGTFSTQEEAADAYDIAAIKFRGLNAVTNFEISRYDVKSILESSTLPIGGAAKRLKDAENAELALDIQRRASNGNPISHLTDGLNGYNNGWHNAIAFHQPQQLSMHYPYPQQRYFGVSKSMILNLIVMFTTFMNFGII